MFSSCTQIQDATTGALGGRARPRGGFLWIFIAGYRALGSSAPAFFLQAQRIQHARSSALGLTGARESFRVFLTRTVSTPARGWLSPSSKQSQDQLRTSSPFRGPATFLDGLSSASLLRWLVQRPVRGHFDQSLTLHARARRCSAALGEGHSVSPSSRSPGARKSINHDESI